MRSMRVILLIAVTVISYFLLTGISSCRGSSTTTSGEAQLFIHENDYDYYLDFEGEGWESGQMAAYLWWNSEQSTSSTQDLNPADLDWHIGDSGILNITSTGHVWGISPGTTNVYATYQGMVSNSVTFTVEGFE